MLTFFKIYRYEAVLSIGNILKIKMAKVNSSEAVQSWKLIMFAYREVIGALENTLKQYDCSISKFQILYYMYFEGSQRPVDIANLISVSRPNVHTFFKRLMADKLIVAGAGARPRYSLTKKGESLFEVVFLEHGEHIDAMMSPMNDEFKNFLHKLRADASDYNKELGFES